MMTLSFKGNALGVKFTKSQEKINTLCTWRITTYLPKNYKELETLIQTLKIYSPNIGMGFGIEKCAMLIMKSVKR